MSLFEKKEGLDISDVLRKNFEINPDMISMSSWGTQWKYLPGPADSSAPIS